jgi:AcrR family transcriptional regulator
LRPFNEELKSEILTISKKEFLEHGYNKTTVRNIATSLGCTTGAIYRYYKDKSAIFDALVKEPCEVLLKQFKETSLNISSCSKDVQVKSVPEMSANEFDWMVDYIYNNYDVFQLICCASEGTKYENYIELLIEIEEESTNRFITTLKKNGMLKSNIDPLMSHILANTLFSGIFEIVRHDLPRNIAMEHMHTLQQFFCSGWNKLLGIE